jgi:hypothetical protein
MLAILKENGFSVYKISFSPDGKCPTFYATSQYDPLRASEFNRFYIKALKKNSNFPYAIAVKEDGVKINVGYLPKEEGYLISMKKYSSPSTCKMQK